VSTEREKEAAAAKAAAVGGGRGFGYERGLPETFEPVDGAIVRLVFAAIEAGANCDALVRFLNEIGSTRDLKAGRSHD
jgi:hypothetical protein